MLFLGFSISTKAVDVNYHKNYLIKGQSDVNSLNFLKQPFYIVKKGDTLSYIAFQILKKTGVQFNSKRVMRLVNKIANHNKISNPNLIVIGKKIDLSLFNIHKTAYLAGDNVNFLGLKKNNKCTECPTRINKTSKTTFDTPVFYYSKIVQSKHFSDLRVSPKYMMRIQTAFTINSKNYNSFKSSKKQNFKKVKLVVSNEKFNSQELFKNKSRQNLSEKTNSENKFFSKKNSFIWPLLDSDNELELFSTNKKTTVEQKVPTFESTYSLKKNVHTSNSVHSQVGYTSKNSDFLKIGGVGDTKKELNILVKDLISKADNPSQLPKFKKFKQIVEVPFGSTPLFLQTLESLKIAEERKNIAFSKFLPRVTSSIGGGIKSGGLNNDSSSQSKNLTVSQLVYDFGVTSRQYQATEKDEISSRYKIDQQRTELLLEIINSFFEVYRAKTLLKLSQGFVESRRDFLASVKVREQIGGSSNADVIRAETKLSEALDRIPIDVQNLKNSEAVFAEYFDNLPSKNIKLHQIPSIEDVIYELIDKNIDKNFKIGDIHNQILAAELNFQAEKRSRFGKFGIQAGYQNTDTNLNTPQEQSSILLTYQLDVFSGFETKAKISQANLKLNALRFELERTRKELIRELQQSENSYEAQSALVLSRVALVKGAELSNQVNRELFELNKTSINDLFRSQEEFLTAAKNLVDATVEKNLSFYRLAAKFGTLLNLFELRT